MKTLLIVDVQNDFLPGGALAVPNGDEVIELINDLLPYFDLILATKDWHPENHISFAKTHGKKEGDTVEVEGRKQELWPVHCVQNTTGSEFAKDLDTHAIEKVFHKGADPLVDSYSAFFDNAHLRKTGLDEYLKQRKITEFYIAGLATDYCVKFSVLDALELGFKTYVILDACRGINPNDVEKATQAMKNAGSKLIQCKDISSQRINKVHNR